MGNFSDALVLVADDLRWAETVEARLVRERVPVVVLNDATAGMAALGASPPARAIVFADALLTPELCTQINKFVQQSESQRPHLCRLVSSLSAGKEFRERTGVAISNVVLADNRLSHAVSILLGLYYKAQRSAERYPVDFRAKVLVGQLKLDGAMTDISEGGGQLLLTCHQEPPSMKLGQRVELAFVAFDKPFKVSAVLRSVRHFTFGQRVELTMGVSFAAPAGGSFVGEIRDLVEDVKSNQEALSAELDDELERITGDLGPAPFGDEGQEMGDADFAAAYNVLDSDALDGGEDLEHIVDDKFEEELEADIAPPRHPLVARAWTLKEQLSTAPIWVQVAVAAAVIALGASVVMLTSDEEVVVATAPVTEADDVGGAAAEDEEGVGAADRAAVPVNVGMEMDAGAGEAQPPAEHELGDVAEAEAAEPAEPTEQAREAEESGDAEALIEEQETEDTTALSAAEATSPVDVEALIEEQELEDTPAPSAAEATSSVGVESLMEQELEDAPAPSAAETTLPVDAESLMEEQAPEDTPAPSAAEETSPLDVEALRKQYGQALANKDWPAAIAIGDKMGDALRKDADRFYAYAQVLLFAKKEPEAAEAFELFTKLHPNEPRAFKALLAAGKIHLKLGDKDKARMLIEQVAASSSSQSTRAAKVLEKNF